MVYSESEVDRIAKVAFEIAQKRGGKLCSVEKSSVLEVSQLWKERVIKQHENYKDVDLSHMYIDNCAMQVIRDPKQFDTIVTGNIFGDIISDAASMLTGPSGCCHPGVLGVPDQVCTSQCTVRHRILPDRIRQTRWRKFYPPQCC